MSIALLRPPDLTALALSLPSTTTRPRSRTNTATSASTSGGASLSINSHALAWDQTYLRITYLVGTMGPSSPTPATSPETEHPRPFDDYDEEDREKRVAASAAAAAAAVVVETTSAAAEKDRSWPAVSREKARRKRAQIQTWCAEVALHGRDALCACACACAIGAPAVVPPSAPAAVASVTECAVCEVCRRPPPEVLPPAAAVVLPSHGLKKALAWLGKRTKRRRGGAAALDDEDEVLRGLRLVRTEMYRADLPARGDEAEGGVNAVVVVEPGGETKKKLSGRSDEDVDHDVDLDDLSGSSHQNKGLLETDARLGRAQRLLEKSQGRRLPAGPCISGIDKELQP